METASPISAKHSASIHAFSFSVGGGNYVPADLDTEGTYEVDADGLLHLRGLYLGSSRHEPAGEPKACEQVFMK
jgi:hypothetical protein